ncbi:tRNA (adenosine(37)-N6)-dimethylallyltransferase MiaA [Pseudohalocynthiibacter aestuariivivens]|jgi:tRNA dimethylallyltransferase|uniref:tRNA dimethylallyltransferase n=1 Tax=Pseudohalocynthiibacter aestuariivivens TaxID=1591409 RepID=A0ABV5JGC6_9RHOB|nr:MULTISPECIES: tRNA (adenosine(37)-N6)-dimethylallyltransferase MiaA [Pseudohalocynthiibacter]MBS9716167.1 tRNA (adenosine(37)-N6)-dimethylallyltransferase MiaA [Pseudohalocynthiibacter aestuariivivens]MCK0101025.1 tRNA (adenosine(37)-N6)-dimethylallyltransferase MiaA [Pseudohalocynthiibacter sp. F2068]
MNKLPDISPELPVLIAGPTAAGKSALALKIAEKSSGMIVNADALQVYDGWRILTARPSAKEEAQAQHHLYGHVSYKHDYSVGHWLRDVAALLIASDQRPIIVGGTGLYFRAMTEGLAEIPNISQSVRKEADALLETLGLPSLLNTLDEKTRQRIDTRNPARVQRAWEVLRETGKGLADWQDETPPPILPLRKTFPIIIDAEREWLNDRIAQRFDAMIEAGALEEARSMLADWDPARLSSKAIGAPELIAHLSRKLDLDVAIENAKTASRQYAKRQRTWFRARMTNWHPYPLP